MSLRPEEITSVIQERIKNFRGDLSLADEGTVLQVGDGIARVWGLSDAMSGELLEFMKHDGTPVYGMVLNLEEDNVGAVLLGSDIGIREGATVRRLNRIVEVPVGEQLLGRVVNPLGIPID